MWTPNGYVVIKVVDQKACSDRWNATIGRIGVVSHKRCIGALSRGRVICGPNMASCRSGEKTCNGRWDAMIGKLGVVSHHF